MDVQLKKEEIPEIITRLTRLLQRITAVTRQMTMYVEQSEIPAMEDALQKRGKMITMAVSMRDALSDFMKTQIAEPEIGMNLLPAAAGLAQADQEWMSALRLQKKQTAEKIENINRRSKLNNYSW
jgi:hypothetical protein